MSFSITSLEGHRPSRSPYTSKNPQFCFFPLALLSPITRRVPPWGTGNGRDVILQVDKQCGCKAGAMRRGTLTQLGAHSSPSLCSPIVWAVPPLSRMRFATPNGVSLTGASPPRRCSAQESEGEESKTGEQFSLDSDRPSHGRVCFAAPNTGAP